MLCHKEYKRNKVRIKLSKGRIGETRTFIDLYINRYVSFYDQFYHNHFQNTGDRNAPSSNCSFSGTDLFCGRKNVGVKQTLPSELVVDFWISLINKSYRQVI